MRRTGNVRSKLMIFALLVSACVPITITCTPPLYDDGYVVVDPCDWDCGGWGFDYYVGP